MELLVSRHAGKRRTGLHSNRPTVPGLQPVLALWSVSLGPPPNNTMLLPTTPQLRRVTEPAVGVTLVYLHTVIRRQMSSPTYWRAQSWDFNPQGLQTLSSLELGGWRVEA